MQDPHPRDLSLRSIREAEERSLALLQYFQTDDLNQLSLAKESSELNEALAPHLQLLAYNCHVEKTFISVFDRDLLYIIAEASPTPNTGPMFGVDCLGLPLSGRLCTYTLDVPTTDENSQPLFQVSDLSKDDRFKSYSFVKDPEGPGFRYYAGVPITTPRGVAIGTVAMFGTQPRASITTSEEVHLRNMSARIMNYLNIRKEAADGQRIKKLVNSLGQFIQDHATNSPNLPSQSMATDINRSPSHTISNGFACFSDKEIFHRASTSIDDALQLGNTGAVMFLNAKPALVTPAVTSSLNDRIISCSTGCRNSLSSCSDEITTQLASMDIKSLLNQYPRGKMWQFDAYGILPAGDSDSEDSSQALTNGVPSRQIDISWDGLIRKISPKARQILMVPLLDAGTSEWTAACFVWSASPTRLFTKTELWSLLTYVQSVMAEKSLQEAKRSGLQKADFIGSISHELRTPLHGILAGLEIMKEEDHLTDLQGSVIDMIETSGEALLETVNQILVFSKINTLEESSRKQSASSSHVSHKRPKHALRLEENADGDDLDAQPSSEFCDVALLVEQAADMVYLGRAKTRLNNVWQTNSIAHPPLDTIPLLHQNGTNNPLGASNGPAVEMLIDIADEDFKIQAKKGPLKRVMVNLIGNAMKYTQQGTVKVSLYKNKTSRTQDSIVFEVKDSGCGMNEAFLRSRLFMPFTQEDPLKPGTGLGLSICKSIVESMGGQIVVDSALGQGSIFRVILPTEMVSRSGRIPTTVKPVVIPRQLLESQRVASNITFFYHKPTTAVLSTQIPPDESSPLSTNTSTSVCSYLRDRFRMAQADTVDSENVKLVVVEGTCFESLSEIDFDCFQRLRTGLFLICDSLAQQLRLERLCKSLHLQHVTFVCKPCGPLKIGSHLESLLASIQGQQDNQESSRDIGRAQSPSRRIDNGQTTIHDSLHTESRNLMTPLDGSTDDGEPTERRNGISAHIQRTTNYLPLRQKSSESLPCKQPRILLVDDNNINLRLLQSFCTKRCYKDVQTAINGQIAVDLVKTRTSAEAFDVIFMDISMPVMNGFEATSAIRSHEKACSSRPARIIALTGLANERDRDMGMNVGMDLYLTKPFRFKEIDGVLQDWSKQETVSP